MTKELYKGVNEDNYLEMNIADKKYDLQETQRLRSVLDQLPPSIFKVQNVGELGSGYGRNYALLKLMFPTSRFVLFEQSQENIDIAVNKMGVPREDCLRRAIQELDWDIFDNWFDILIDWWTLSYLTTDDISRVLDGLKVALKPSGLFIICLPVKLRDASRPGPTDKGMKYRTIWEYEELFSGAGFGALSQGKGPTVYTPGDIDGETVYGQEAIWVLKPEPMRAMRSKNFGN